MRLTNPIETLAAAIYHAAHVALPHLEYEQRDFRAEHELPAPVRAKLREEVNAGTAKYPTKSVRRRPGADECVVLGMFSETWGSTALGFGGMGGAAMTAAYTTVIRGPAGHVAVYWHGRFAYLIDPRTQTAEQAQAFAEGLMTHQTASRSEAAAKYGALLPSCED